MALSLVVVFAISVVFVFPGSGGAFGRQDYYMNPALPKHLPEVEFMLNSYDSAYTVYINSGYQWHTFYGSSSNDFGNAIAVDDDGSVYVTGGSGGSWNGPDGEIPLNAHAGADYYDDIFIVKLDYNGTYYWHTFHGSADTDMAYAIALDLSTNIYIAGMSLDTWNGPDGEEPINVYAGDRDILIIKTHSTLTLSSDAALSSLTVSPGNLTPAFDPATTAYTVAVAHDIASIDVTAALSDENASLTIGGVPAASGVL